MATITHVSTLDYVAKCLVKIPNCSKLSSATTTILSYGAIISVYIGTDDSITALTDDGIDELKDMIRDARSTPET